MSGTGPTAGPGRAPARPRQVTVAGVMATVACVLLLFALFDAMSSVGSTETQKSVQDFLDTGPGGSLGLGVDGVTDIIRGLVLFSGALAAAGAILAVYCLRRHRGARIGLSVVAVLMLFTTTFVAGLLPFVVALASSMLWRREARDWFDGREPPPRSLGQSSTSPAASGSSADGPRPTTAAWTPPEPGQSPPAATSPFGAPPTGAGRPAPYATGRPPHDVGPGGAPIYGMPQQGARRPASVTAAVWLTWASCLVTLLLLSLLVLVLLVDRTALVTELQKNPSIADAGYSTDRLVSSLWVVAAIGIFWSLAAIALGVLAFQGFRAGQVGLLVSAGMAALLGIATIVVPVLAVTTVVLLLVGPSNAWFASRRTAGPSRPSGPSGPSGPSAGGTPAGSAGPGGSGSPGDSGRPPVW
jgi:hypothetical protein